MTTMTTDVMTASRPSAGILAEIEARAVDAPTEDGDWCAVDERGVYSPVQIEISTWTEVVDEYGDSIDEDDPVAVARGQKAQRSEVRVYDPGVEVARVLPCGMRWVRFEALIGAFAQVTAERDALRARAEVTAERTHDHDGRSRLAGLDAIEARARATGVDLWDVSCDVNDPHDQCAMVVLRSDHGVCVAPFLTRAAAEFIAHAREDVPALVEEVRRLGAIVEGRTTPPTWQEIERHHESGGSWIFSAGGVADVSERASVTHRWADDHRDLPGMGGCRWWPLDTHGRLCAWPVVTR
jgi:hypothetical protein